ncbi:hypothetical protein J6590_075681 [Homalodisca vitripennis]|nr:hypothetical protein J6590_075681 [Homalodisca vitripennis]
MKKALCIKGGLLTSASSKGERQRVGQSDNTYSDVLSTLERNFARATAAAPRQLATRSK